MQNVEIPNSQIIRDLVATCRSLGYEKFFSNNLNLQVRSTLMGTKNSYENRPNPFFVFVFFNLMETRMVQIRIAKSV